MKKVLFTSILLLSLVSFGGNVYAQDATGGDNTEATTPSESSASVDFKASEGGKTLTISGHGDLTSYMTTERSARIFTDKAVGYVFTGANAGTSVSANDSYNAANTYYRADYTYNLLCQGVPNNYNFDVKSTTTWKETADFSNLYAINYVNTKNGSHVIGMAKKVTSESTPDLTSTWSYDELSNQAYYIISDVNIAGQQIDIETLEENGYQTISLSDFSKKYVEVSATYTVWNSGVVFVKHANSESYESLLAGKTYNYVDGDSFYTATASFVKIDNNVEFFAANAEYLKEDPKQITVAQLALSKIKQGAYENVVFKNESTTEPLMIDKSIIRAIMYPDFIASQAQTANKSLLNLDLGEATVNNFDGRNLLPTDEANNDWLANQHLNVQSITLPLNSKTTNETTSEEEMVLPANALGGLTGCLSLTDVKVPDGYTKIASQAFYQASHLKSVELGNNVTEIGEKAFFASGLQNVELNGNLKTIGKFAFAGTGLTSLTLPKNLDKVCDGAFWNLKQLYVIELNENLRYIGNGAFGCDGDLGDKCKTQTTIKIPASVKYIGAYAFSERKYQDVYFLGKVAPVCPEGTFDDGQNKRHEGTAFTSTDDKVHFGNSGFSTSEKHSPLADDVNQGYANRENYINGGFYFTILHYPSDATDVDTYTDTTRKYLCRVQENGNINTEQTTVGQETLGDIDYWDAQQVQTTVDPGYADTYVGTQYVWPSHSQFTRAYATAAKGVKWDGVTPYAPKLSADALAVLKEAGYDITDKKLAQKAYIGTRKFAIANGDGKSLPNYKFEVKPGEWWTICVPFNMTKKQVLDAFGAETQLCLFRSVVRQIDINNMNHISLNFTLSTLKNKTSDDKGKKLQTEAGRWDYDTMEESEDVPDDNDIVLWAHESYMIKPYGGAYSDKEPTYVMANYEPVEGSPLPTIVHATTKTLGQADDFTEEYRFVGNYLGNSDARATEVRIPQYSYVYATTKKEPNICKFRFYTGTSAVWKPNKSVVQTNNRGGGLFDYNNFFGGEKGSTLPGAAKQASIFGDEDFGQTTGIDDVTIVVGSETLTPIFNLEGKMVRANGNVEGLAKGVYVKGGKKFIVK